MVAIHFKSIVSKPALREAWEEVKRKGAAGGIDGVTLQQFEKGRDGFLHQLHEQLLAGVWIPQPYLQIKIPKKKSDLRKLGLLCVGDKVVQLAIKKRIEPLFERLFLANGYGYRPHKGHNRAVKYAHHWCRNTKYKYAIQLDIDNYFDTINHELLFHRLSALVVDAEIRRLIELSMKMGVVATNQKWEDTVRGVPQGAVLSPLLSNFYLHAFDQFVVSKTKSYVRYADDLLIFCETKEQAQEWVDSCSQFLSERLFLHLNAPKIHVIDEGFEFLGIWFSRERLSISPAKQKKLKERVCGLEWTFEGLSAKSIKTLEGIDRYYGAFIERETLLFLEQTLYECLDRMVRQAYVNIKSKSVLNHMLASIPCFSSSINEARKSSEKRLLELYTTLKNNEINQQHEAKNKRAIAKRRRESRKREGVSNELVVTSYGTSIGVGKGGLTLKSSGKNQFIPFANHIKHVTLLGDGISISSNAIAYCAERDITVDLFSSTGKHLGSFLSPSYIETSLWHKQSELAELRRVELAKMILVGKLRNQLNLIQYYHKYHKKKNEELEACFVEVKRGIGGVIKQLKDKGEMSKSLITMEAIGAQYYWRYLKLLLTDERIQFTHRERHGATDLVNCMLNYGYALLYGRIWKAVLQCKLNPHESVIHQKSKNKPTLVYDIIELFRAQAVDRVICSLILKRHPLKMNNGQLDVATKKLIVRAIFERLARYEHYRGTDTTLNEIIREQVKEIAVWIDVGKRFKSYVAKW